MTQKMIYAFQTKSFPKSLINIESPEQELTFADLFIHYRRFSKSLNDSTFAKTLNFLTSDGKYNYLAYLMADNKGHRIYNPTKSIFKSSGNAIAA